MRRRGNGWKAWIPSLTGLLAGGCSLGILGAGPPDVTVYDLPERPAIEGTPLLNPDGSPVAGVRLYSLPTEESGQIRPRVVFSEGGWQAFSAWLREVLARFNANRCALLAVNGETDERCEALK